MDVSPLETAPLSCTRGEWRDLFIEGDPAPPFKESTHVDTLRFRLLSEDRFCSDFLAPLLAPDDVSYKSASLSSPSPRAILLRPQLIL
jgi:hypothetical protein